MALSQSLSTKDIALFKAVIKKTKREKVSWEAIAKVSDHKTAKYARDRFATVQKKMISEASTTGNSATSQPSDKDFALLSAYIKIAVVNVDWQVIADESGHQTAKYARDRWAVIKQKLVDEGNTGAQHSAPESHERATDSPKTSNGSRKRKAAAAAETNSEPTVSKKSKACRDAVARAYEDEETGSPGEREAGHPCDQTKSIYGFDFDLA